MALELVSHHLLTFELVDLITLLVDMSDGAHTMLAISFLRVDKI